MSSRSNPYYGILHQETDKVYPFLTFDIMEGFGHSFVDRIVISLIAKKVLNVSKHSKKIGDGVYLNKFGINKLYSHMLEEKKATRKLIRDEIRNFLDTVKR